MRQHYSSANNKYIAVFIDVGTHNVRVTTWEQPRAGVQSSLPQVSNVPRRWARAKSGAESSTGVVALITVTWGLSCDTIV